MIEAVEFHVRYVLSDENGETRAERNARFGMDEKTPDPPKLEDYANNLWELFKDISGSVQRVVQGSARRLSPTDFVHWQQMSGNNLTHREYGFLKIMDMTYCECLNEELRAFQERQLNDTDKTE